MSIKLRKAAVFLAGAVAGGAGVAVGLRGSPRDAEPPGRDAPRAAVERALDRPVDDIAIDNVALTEALRRLGDAAGVRVVVDSKAMDAEGVDYESPLLMLRAARLPLADALDVLTDQLATPTARVVWLVGYDHVLVTTRAAARKYDWAVSVRAYDVRDLLSAPIPYFRPAGAPPYWPHASPEAAADAAAIRAAQAARMVPSPSEVPEPSPAETLCSLAATAMARGDTSWCDFGQKSFGTVRCVGGRLVVVGFEADQRAVHYLLSRLRNPSAAPPTVRPDGGDKIDWMLQNR